MGLLITHAARESNMITDTTPSAKPFSLKLTTAPVDSGLNDVFHFTAGSKEVVVDYIDLLARARTNPGPSRPLKRRRPLLDLDTGLPPPPYGKKKRRLRLFLITSQLSPKFSDPATYAVDRGPSRIAVWARQRALGRRNILRKAAILNRIRLMVRDGTLTTSKARLESGEKKLEQALEKRVSNVNGLPIKTEEGRQEFDEIGRTMMSWNAHMRVGSDAPQPPMDPFVALSDTPYPSPTLAPTAGSTNPMPPKPKSSRPPSPSPLGLSNYDALDLEEDHYHGSYDQIGEGYDDDAWAKPSPPVSEPDEKEGDEVYSDFNVLDSTETEEDLDQSEPFISSYISYESDDDLARQEDVSRHLAANPPLTTSATGVYYPHAPRATKPPAPASTTATASNTTWIHGYPTPSLSRTESYANSVPEAPKVFYPHAPRPNLDSTATSSWVNGRLAPQLSAADIAAANGCVPFSQGYPTPTFSSAESCPEMYPVTTSYVTPTIYYPHAPRARTSFATPPLLSRAHSYSGSTSVSTPYSASLPAYSTSVSGYSTPSSVYSTSMPIEAPRVYYPHAPRPRMASSSNTNWVNGYLAPHLSDSALGGDFEESDDEMERQSKRSRYS